MKSNTADEVFKRKQFEDEIRAEERQKRRRFDTILFLGIFISLVFVITTLLVQPVKIGVQGSMDMKAFGKLIPYGTDSRLDALGGGGSVKVDIEMPAYMVLNIQKDLEVWYNGQNRYR